MKTIGFNHDLKDAGWVSEMNFVAAEVEITFNFLGVNHTVKIDSSMVWKGGDLTYSSPEENYIADLIDNVIRPSLSIECVKLISRL